MSSFTKDVLSEFKAYPTEKLEDVAVQAVCNVTSAIIMFGH